MNAETRTSLKALSQTLNWEPAQTVIITMKEDMDGRTYHVSSLQGDWWVGRGCGGYFITDTDPWDENTYSGDLPCAESTEKKYFYEVQRIFRAREDDADHPTEETRREWMLKHHF